MNLKTRLALLFSLSVFVILVASAIPIYFLNETFRKNEFTKRLMLEAAENFEIFTRNPDITPETVAALKENASNSLANEEVLIFNSSMRPVFLSKDSSVRAISSKMLSLAKIGGHYEFAEGNKEFLILYKRFNNRPYYIAVSGFDVFGRRKTDNIKLLLAISILGGMSLSGLLAFFYVRQSIKPLENLKNEIESVTVQNLKHRITIPKNNNEVWQIADKFNAMLERLELAFEQRKNFVQHASHELRTPLANMLLQTESALNKDLTPDEYKNILHSLKEDQSNLIELTNSLLALSRYETINTAIRDWTNIRVDEILYQIVDFVKQVWPESVVSIDFETMPEEESDLEVSGNESLIKSALQNLVKNAIQYSDNSRVKVMISPEPDRIVLKFENFGRQLTPEEQSKLFIPFFRGENAGYKKGYGLGLAIVERIILVHRGKIMYEPVGENINRFTVILLRQPPLS